MNLKKLFIPTLAIILIVTGILVVYMYNSSTTIPSIQIATGMDFNACINNTKDNPQCKDCCDCLSDTDGATRTNCRDTCAAHDFTANSGFIQVHAPSVLGASGDYTQCTQISGSNQCKACCEETLWLQCWDYRFCRTACNVTYGDPKHEIAK